MRTLTLIAAALLASARIAAADPLVTGVNSVTLTVGDADRAAEFYTGTLGFQKVSDAEVAGDAYEHLEGTFGLRLRVVRLKLGDEALELAESGHAAGRPIPADSRSNDRWFQHVAIIVSDMDKAYAWLRARHVRHVSTEPADAAGLEPERGRHQGVLLPRPGRPQPRGPVVPAGQGRRRSGTARRRPAVPRHRPHRDRRSPTPTQSLAFYRDRSA